MGKHNKNFNKNKVATENKTEEKKEVNAVEEFWLEKILPHQVETLPYEKLTAQEQSIIDKLKNNIPINDDELTIIKKTTAEYSEALKKYNAEEIVESREDFEDIVVTEHELIDLVFDSKKDKYLTMNIPFESGSKKIKFTIKPLDDSRAVKMTEQHIDIYKDLSPEELRVQQKGVRGDKLSKAEQDVIEHINKKLTNIQIDDRVKQINEFLAWQIEPPTSEDLSFKIKFWENFPFNSKMSLFLKVQDILGLSEEFDDKLFPDE